MKIKTALLSLLLIITLLPIGAYAGDGSKSSGFDMLAAIGVAEEGDVLSEGSATVTRAQFIRYAVRATGMSAQSIAASEDTVPFADVSSSHEDFVYISAAVKLGMISGANGFFLPDAPISMHAAAKIAIHILDYQIMAEAHGGYPVGYMKYANSFDLFDGCTIADESALTAEDVSVLLVNVLGADVLVTTSIGTDGNKYSSMENLLSQRHKIRRTQGVVTANAYTSLSADEGLGSKEYIEIDSILYKVSGTADAYAMLGCSVEAYYKEDSSSARTLVYACVMPDENEVVTVKGEDITGVTMTELSYYEGEEEEKLKISKSVSVIRNGNLAAITSANVQSVMKPSNGIVTLIDNNANGDVDAVIVEDYRTVMVRGISAKTYSVSDGLGGSSIELNPFAANYDIYIEKNGKAAGFDDIAVNDVILYYESAADDIAFKKLIISSTSVSGTVDEIDYSDNSVSIKGVFYKFADSVKSKLSLASNGVFYADAFGKIVYFDSEPKDIVYGYVTNMKKGSFDDYQVKIFTENNRWVTLPFAAKVRHNGTTVTSAELYAELGGEALVKQLVTYLVSDDRKIIRLDTAESYTKGSDEEQVAIEKQTFRLSDTYTQTNYRADGPSFEDYCYLTNTIIFSVPEDGEDYSDDKFAIISYNDLVNSGVYSNVKVYDMDELGKAAACVMGVVEKSLGETLMIVDSVVDALNDEGEKVKAVRGFYSGMEAKILEAAGSNAVGGTVLNKGDVIRTALDADGCIVSISKLLDAKTQTDQKLRDGGAYAIFTFIAGEVKALDEKAGLISVDCDANGRNSVTRLTSLKSVYIYDRKADTMMTGSLADVGVGDYIYMTSRYLRANSIIIVKK